MNDLRLVLLIIGAVLLAAIYLWEVVQRRRARRHEPAPWEEDELVLPPEGAVRPLLAEDQEPDGEALERLRGLSALPGEQPAAGDRREVLAITVIAPGERRLAGVAIHQALAEAGLEHGAMGIYHRQVAGETRFSAANVLKPGTLDPQEAAALATPGLALFLCLPGPREPRAALEEMVATARALAAALDARVCDGARNPLTEQALNHLRERVAEHERRRLLHP